MEATLRPSSARPALMNAAALLESGRRALGAALSLPFDAMRAEYAAAVQMGLARRSMLASRDFEAMVDALERCTLGAFARRV